jgi:cyclopropane-fatty-acyl-phospholipid synthase
MLMNVLVSPLSFSDNLRRRFRASFADRLPSLSVGELVVRLPDGTDIRRRGDAAGPRAEIEFHSWRAIMRILVDGEDGFADGYLANEWSSPDLLQVLELAMRNETAFARRGDSSLLRRAANRILHSLRSNTLRGSRRNIAAHYDLGNAFYGAWLDASMNYSSGLYMSEDTLSQAQSRKLDRIIELLDVSGNERVLEIGCGWGALVERLVRRGAHVTGITLSSEQLAFTQMRLTGVGLAASADIKLEDYRVVQGRFDRIVSIEMLEAVGERYWPLYFQKLRSCLVDGGTVVLQAITIDDKRFDDYRKRPDFIQRYIFPGGMLPTKAKIEKLAAQSGLALVHRHDFGMSYAQTLAVWRYRFLSAWPHIENMGFDARFKRMWEYYLAYCETGFRAGSVDVSLFKLTA